MAAQPLTQVEQNVFKALVSEDMSVLRSGGESFFLPKGTIVSTVSEIEKAFVGNELKGNKQYKDKYVLVDGKVGEVMVGALDRVEVTLKGGKNMFLPPVATFIPQDEQKNLLADLEKNQKITLICKCNGMSAGLLRFTGCQFPSFYAERVEKRINNALNSFRNGTTGDVRVDGLLKNIVAITALMTDEQKAQCTDLPNSLKVFSKVSANFSPETMNDPRVKARFKDLGF